MIAHYQIFDLAAEEDNEVGNGMVALDEAEIELQIRLFLKYLHMSKTEQTAQKTSKVLALNFPTSIGHKLDVFMVLRTLFLEPRGTKATTGEQRLPTVKGPHFPSKAADSKRGILGALDSSVRVT